MEKESPRLLIAYDLQKPNRTEEEYGELYTALESLGAKRIQESVWVVRTDESVAAMSHKLQRYIHLKDRLLVTCIGDFTSHKGINKIRPI